MMPRYEIFFCCHWGVEWGVTTSFRCRPRDYILTPWKDYDDGDDDDTDDGDCCRWWMVMDGDTDHDDEDDDG